MIRRCCLTLLACLCCIVASAQQQTVNVRLRNATLAQLFKVIERQTTYVFSYQSNALDNLGGITMNRRDATVSSVLNEAFRGRGLTFDIVSEHSIVVTKSGSKSSDASKTANQTVRKVKGTVTDKNGEPIIGATVREQGSSAGTITDVDGNFNIGVSDGAVLEVSYVGYVTQRVRANRQTMNVTLGEDTKIMDEVVVVGYGVQKKSDLTGSVASVTSETIEGRPQPNIIQSLEGVVPGLNVSITGSNAEGSSSQTRIRGTKSINADNKPLIILDGIPFDGPWSEINPDDVERIEVLKDASSSAIYGARGANGVILVTSKRGDKGKLNVSYNGFVTIDQPINFPNLMNGEEFWKYKLEALRDANTTEPTEDNPEPWMGSFTQTELDMHEAGESTDWLKEVTRTGVRQQHNLSLRGGADKTRFFISLNYANNKGVAKGNQFQRYNVRFNLDQDFTSWLRFTTSTQLGRYDRGGSSASFSRAFRMPSLTRAYNADGSISNSSWEDSSEAFAVNPLSSLNNLTNDVRMKVITNNAFVVTIPYVKGLSYKLNTGYTYSNSSWKQYQGMDTYYGARANGILNTDDWHSEDWIVENILSYNCDFGKHHLFVTALYSAQSKVYEQNTMEGKGFPNDVMYYYQMNKALTSSGNQNYWKENHLSQMGRVNYTYDNRYLLTLTARRDGYSAFGNNSKFGVFPSAAVGWNISNEQFFKPVASVVSNLKLRLSWGKNGNEAISAYTTLPNLSTFNYLNDDHSVKYGFYPSKLASPSLGWETTSSFNAGFDMSLWNGRIQSTFDFYVSKTNDLLLNHSIPTINGTGSIMENIGSTKGHGFEWQVISNNISLRNFTWSTTFNISHHHTEIVDVGIYDENGKAIDDVASRWFIGQPISVNYDYRKIGIWQIEDKNNPNGPQDSRNNYSIPGYIKYQDVNDDGVINTEDRQIIGSTEPTVNMSLMNSFSYKDFYLSFFLTAQLGQTAYNALYTCSTMSYRQNRLMVNFWTPENPTNDYPKNSLDTSVNPMDAGFYQKTDYLRLADITFGYRVPKNLLKGFFLHGVEAYVNMKNVFTVTGWTGLDPEFTGDQYATPATRSFTFGVKLDI